MRNQNQNNIKLTVAITLTLLLAVVNGVGIAKLNLQKIMPIQSGYFNRLAFNSSSWQDDNSHSMSQNGSLVIQMLYPYDSSQFDVYVFNQNEQLQYENYILNVKSIKSQRSCVEAMQLNISESQIQLKTQIYSNNLTSLDGFSVVVDNTKYPCNGGSYYPLLQLHYDYSITFTFEYTYYYAYKSVILFGVLFVLIYFSGIIIFYFRQRKQRKKQLQRQHIENKMMEQQDLQEDSDNDDPNSSNMDGDFDSNKSVVNSLGSFSAGFQKSYNSKSLYQMNQIKSNNNLASKANTQSGKSIYGAMNNNNNNNNNSIDDSQNQSQTNSKYARGMDSRRDTSNIGQRNEGFSISSSSQGDLDEQGFSKRVSQNNKPSHNSLSRNYQNQFDDFRFTKTE